MFFKKKVRHWPIVVFGTIFFAIIAATVVLIILLFSKVNKNNIAEDIAIVEDMIITPDILFESYSHSIANLIESVSGENIDFEAIIEKTEKKLFEIRVPREKREEHLEVILKLRGTENINDLIILIKNLKIRN